MAHYAGLVAAGLYPSPVGAAHFVTTTTHKTLRGPRGGLILADAENSKLINSAVFPGTQGGPLMHVIAAKAVAFKEAQPPVQDLPGAGARQRARNGGDAAERGLRIVSGGTDCHLFLVDLRARTSPARRGSRARRAHITVNKNAMPNDPEKPSSPAVSAWGPRRSRRAVS